MVFAPFWTMTLPPLPPPPPHHSTTAPTRTLSTFNEYSRYTARTHFCLPLDDSFSVDAYLLRMAHAMRAHVTYLYVWTVVLHCAAAFGRRDCRYLRLLQAACSAHIVVLV